MVENILSKKPLLGDLPKPSSYQSIVTNAEEGLSTWDLMKLTLCMAGMQFTWTVELSYGTPYLISLGMSTELIALVWLAGPLSGLIIQPLVGAYSDKSTFKLGRRRPFIIVGGILVCLSIVGIAYSVECAKLFLGYIHHINDNTEKEVRNLAIKIAVVAFYFLDFSLNAVMASCRALILDIPPLYQQEIANAWAARMIHAGNVVGYFVGFINLRETFRFLGGSQMQVLCVIAIIVLILSLLITCLSVQETVYESLDEHEQPWYQALYYIYDAFRYLPRPVQKVCNVQFFNWMGTFPFLFYSTAWIVDIYTQNQPFGKPDVFEDATRIGSLALLLSSIVSVLAGTILPQLTPRTYPTRNPLTVYNIFTSSHILFFFFMMATFFVNNVTEAILIITLVGIPFAIWMWIPYALIGEYVRIESEKVVVNNTRIPKNNGDVEEHLRDVYTIAEASTSQTSESTDSCQTVENGQEFDAGMVLGVHNMYIVFPQFVTALVSSAIFKIVKDINGGHDAGAVGWILRFGGVMILAAAVLSRYIEPMTVVKR